MKKETFVLLPGYDGDGIGTFSELNSLLSVKHNCLVINYPYYGQTDRVYTLDELVSYVHKITNQRKLSRFHLVGFSMGGFVAAAYAIRYSSQLKSLTLISSAVTPLLSPLNQLSLVMAYHLFKIPLLARLFSLIYCSPYLSDMVKDSPLPPPRDNFPVAEGYPVFGTLANVLYESTHSQLSTQAKLAKLVKKAILFADDPSFPAAIYSPILTDLGFRIVVHDHGGHATHPDYWNIVGKDLLR